MADKRISQLIERTDIANNDVLPIVASGATTTNKVTISTIQEWMQDNLDVGVTSVGITIGSTGTDVNVSGSPITTSGNITINIPTASATNRGLLSSSDWSSFNSKLSSVGLTMPSAFTVSNSPLTANGTIAVTGAGTVAQYIRGDGSLADFPEAGGGGASVSYYLNGSVSQGTIGGIAYREMNKTPILGAGTNFTIAADGYIASFITDAGDPNLLLIPGGNWNLETYFQASSGGGTPSFYVELYKVDSGGTATLIASNSANPELIAFGTTTTAYFSSLAVPPTVLTLTDRLALRYYVTHSGRTITMHTEDANLCQVITTFTTGLTALNGLTAQVQNFATGTSGTDFNISSTSATHTFNLPDASASNRGAVTTGSQIFGGVKTFANGLSLSAVGGSNQVTRIVNIGTLHEGSATLNQIGFNSGNNIYFGKGLSNGGVISWNNAAVRYYTLPDADGTIALTSQIPANPVGGTGAAGRVAYWNGTGTITSDSLFQWNDFSKRLGIGRTPTVSLDVEGAGFFSTSVTSQQNNITADGAGVVLQGYVDNALRIAVRGSGYNSGARGGLLASTGDFSGALNGTSASFTGNGLFGGSSAVSGLAGGISVNGSTNSGINFRIADALRGYAYVAGNGSMNFESTSGNIVLSPNGSPALTIAASTGAATFSSSVTANRYLINGSNGNSGQIIQQGDLLGTAATNLLLQSSSGNSIGFLTNGSNDFRMFINTSGNVGIGTASPLAPLHVVGSSSGAVQAMIHNTNGGANSSAELVFGTWGGAIPTGSGNPGPSAKIVALNTNAGNASTDLTFHTYSSSSTSAERMRITSDAYLRMAASSGGIQFNGDTAAANALDDYEEGTWTPTSASGGLTFGVDSANYTKIGRLVTAQCYLTITGAGNTNGVIIGGLPFNNRSNAWSPGALDVSRCSRVGAIARVEGGGARIELLVSSGSTSLDRIEVKGNDFGTGYIILTVTYQSA